MSSSAEFLPDDILYTSDEEDEKGYIIHVQPLQEQHYTLWDDNDDEELEPQKPIDFDIDMDKLFRPSYIPYCLEGEGWQHLPLAYKEVTYNDYPCPGPKHDLKDLVSDGKWTERDTLEY